MRIRKYTGKDMQEALAKVRTDLGSEAVILNSRKVKRHGIISWFTKPYFEVLAAIDENYQPLSRIRKESVQVERAMSQPGVNRRSVDREPIPGAITPNQMNNTHVSRAAYTNDFPLKSEAIQTKALYESQSRQDVHLQSDYPLRQPEQVVNPLVQAADSELEKLKIQVNTMSDLLMKIQQKSSSDSKNDTGSFDHTMNAQKENHHSLGLEEKRTMVNTNQKDEPIAMNREIFFEEQGTKAVGNNTVEQGTKVVGNNTVEQATKAVGNNTVEQGTKVVGNNTVEQATKAVGNNNVEQGTKIVGNNTENHDAKITEIHNEDHDDQIDENSIEKKAGLNQVLFMSNSIAVMNKNKEPLNNRVVPEKIKAEELQVDKSELSSRLMSVMLQQLINLDIEESIAERILGKVKELLPGNASREDIIRQTERVLAAALGEPHTIQTKDNGKPLVVVVIGPTGVGKTTTLAKIAADFSLNKGKKVGLITADTYRIAAVEQLKTYAEILNLTVTVVYSPEDIREAIHLHADKDIIMVDTAGRSHHHREQFDELKLLLYELKADEVFLVLSGNTGKIAGREVLEHYSFMKDYKLLFTKLDETPVPGLIFNTRLRSGKPLSYITVGQSVPDDLEVADPKTLAAGFMSQVIF